MKADQLLRAALIFIAGFGLCGMLAIIAAAKSNYGLAWLMVGAGFPALVGYLSVLYAMWRLGNGR